MFHLSKIELLGLLLGVGGGGSVSYAQVSIPHGVSVMHLPASALVRPTAAGVRQYFLWPQYQSSPYYLASADTTAIPLLEGPTYGVYYAGQGRTNHTPSRYQVVYWLHNDLFWVERPDDLLAQRKALKQWLKAVAPRVDNSDRQRVRTKVESLLKENQKQVDSGVF